MSTDRPDRPSIAELEEHFRELTQLMYDTDVPIPTLEARVYPHLAPDVIFEDPWLRAHGFRRFTTGLRGFDRVIHFDFDIFQIGVQPDARGGGRAIVDGVMNLRQLGFYTYPLRTILVYDFVLTEGSFQITRLEEMWSFADMIANAPLLVGKLYDRVFRPAAGHVFTALFALSCALFPRKER